MFQQLADEGGDTIKCVVHEGYFFPAMQDIRSVTELKSVKIRDDDVILSTYPKAGTHWVFEVLRQLLSGEVIQDKVTMGSSFMEMTTEDKYADLPSPRVLSTHVHVDQLPVDMIKRRIKIVNVIRNPKDTTVSFYHFLKKIPPLEYDGKWENFVRSLTTGKFVYGSWFDHVHDWATIKKEHPDYPIIYVQYEDMKRDQMGEMRRMCKMLGVERTDSFLAKVMESTSFSNMKAQKPSQIIFRKGTVGDWKNWFTVAQNEWFDQLYQQKMEDCPLTLDYV